MNFLSFNNAEILCCQYKSSISAMGSNSFDTRSFDESYSIKQQNQKDTVANNLPIRHKN